MMENEIEPEEGQESVPGDPVENQKEGEEEKVLEQLVKFVVVISVQPNATGKWKDASFRLDFPTQAPVETTKLRAWSQKHDKDVQPFDEPQGDENGTENRKKSNTPYTWTTAFEATVDANWARNINQNPNLLVTVSSRKAMWGGVFPVDISNFLDGDTVLNSEWGTYPGTKGRYIAPPEAIGLELDAIRVTVYAENPVLTPDLSQMLNPFAVKLLSARPLPGLIIEEDNVKMLPFILDPLTKEKDHFMLQKQHCQPIYATMDILPGLLDCKRHVRTVGFQQGPGKVSFGCKTTVLIGELDADSVAEYLETKPLVVYLHDRDVDLITTKKQLEFATMRWKRLYDTSRPSTADDGEDNGSSTRLGKIVETDRIAFNELRSILDSHSNAQTRGKATFCLDELWSSSRQLVDRYREDLYGVSQPRFSAQHKAAKIKIRAGVVPLKRSIPIGGDVEKDELDIGETEILVRDPGRYLDAGTEIRIEASVTHPIHDHPSCTPAVKRSPPFSRVVFMFQYQNSKLMQRIRAALTSINSKALPHCESLRSYELTEEERVLADNGSLDIVTGFQVVDDDFRIIVLEGVTAKGIKTLFEMIPQNEANNEQSRILFNPDLCFKNRIYTEFHVDMKIIRLRDPLVYIVRAPEIYDRFKVDLKCHQALTFLSEIRSAVRSKVLARNTVYPTPSMLTKVESKYGESVSIEDMDGVPKKRGASDRNRARVTSREQVSKAPEIDDENGDQLVGSVDAKKQPRRKADTDCWNKEFLQARAKREERDYLVEHREMRLKMKQECKERIQRRAAQDEELMRSYEGKQVFTYSGQKLNFTEWQYDQWRKRLANHSNVTYTYSKQFQSLSFPLVKEEQIIKDQEEEARQRFITKRGFVYPASRTSAECRQGRRSVSEARAEDLKQPWAEPKPARDHREAGCGPDFDCIPTNEYDLFGGYHKDGTKNPAFFTSVHLVQAGIEVEQEEKARKEKQQWLDKVVVENIHFVPHQSLRGEKACQLDKYKDILATKPKKKGIRIVRKAKLPSGRPVPLRTPPVSMFNGLTS